MTLRVGQFPSGDYPIGQFPGGEYPLGALRPVAMGCGSGRSRAYPLWVSGPLTPDGSRVFRGYYRMRSAFGPGIHWGAQTCVPDNLIGGRGPDVSPEFRVMRGFGDAVVYEGADTGWPPKDAAPQDWLYTIGNMDPYTIGNGFKVSRRRRGLRGLGDDTVDSIRIYVPRLAAGLYAIDLYETGLTQDSMPPAEPIETQRWNNRIATKFSQEAHRLLGFVPVVHEPEGSDVIYAHMKNATDHASAERIWKPMQNALNRARNATGVGAPADPYAGQPRAWEGAVAPIPGPGPAPEPIRPDPKKTMIDFILGTALVVGGIVLF